MKNIRKTVLFFIAILVIVVFMPSYGCKRDPLKFDRVTLEHVVPLWFHEIKKTPQHYQTCWNTVYTILFEKLENYRGLIDHHTDHHMINITKPFLPFNDPHDVRIAYKNQNDEANLFNSVIFYARKALTRRLCGEYSDYIPFSLALGCFEIPFAPEEEYAMLSTLRFLRRLSSDDGGVKKETWAFCNTRAKGIGVQISPVGIISVFLATEGFGNESNKIQVKASLNRTTEPFKFSKGLCFAKPEDVIENFSRQTRPLFDSNSNLAQLSECVLAESTQKDLLFRILDKPLYPEFSGQVIRLKTYLNHNNPIQNTINVLETAKSRLKQNAAVLSYDAMKIIVLITSSSYVINHAPKFFTLSHVSLANPALAKFQITKKSRHESYYEFKDICTFIDMCECDADIFAVAMLLAKSEQIVQQIAGGEFHIDPIEQAIKESSIEFQLAKIDRRNSEVLIEQLESISTIFEDRNDIAISINLPEMHNSEPVRLYHEPDTNIALVRIRTGSNDNMCALMALGVLTPDDVKNIVKIFHCDENILQNIIQGNNINYETLWKILGKREQITDDDNWWKIISEALNATIIIYQQNENHELVNTIQHGNGKRRIYMFLRTGHYNALIPATEHLRIKETILCNAHYNSMF